jgi:hypothetical protein
MNRQGGASNCGICGFCTLPLLSPSHLVWSLWAAHLHYGPQGLCREPHEVLLNEQLLSISCTSSVSIPNLLWLLLLSYFTLPLASASLTA